MWPDRVSNPGPLALESDALPTALRNPAICAVSMGTDLKMKSNKCQKPIRQCL